VSRAQSSNEQLRALPRVFIEDATPDEPIELPEDELVKLRKVLRLSAGSKIAVLPNDGSLLKCTFTGRMAEPLEQFWPDSESEIHLTVAQSLPKGDKLEEIVRACTELGAARFLLFNSDRTIVRWDERKVIDRIRRLNAIVREACEISFRTRLPEIEWAGTLQEVLEREPKAIVLSEREGVTALLGPVGRRCAIVVGPEGGWSQAEHQRIGDRAVTLGPRVLRVDHAAAAAAAVLLIESR
jgi:16S rRNA (uracil1498-N3)-methyltransferase